MGVVESQCIFSVITERLHSIFLLMVYFQSCHRETARVFFDLQCIFGVVTKRLMAFFESWCIFVVWMQVHGPARCDIDLAMVNDLKLMVCFFSNCRLCDLMR